MTIHWKLVAIFTTLCKSLFLFLVAIFDTTAPSAGCLLDQSVVYAELQKHTNTQA